MIEEERQQVKEEEKARERGDGFHREGPLSNTTVRQLRLATSQYHCDVLYEIAWGVGSSSTSYRKEE
jgi:hypothetical protein